MRFEIKGIPLPILICDMAEGESIKTEKGAMSWMTDNMKMETNAGGGLGKMFTRAVTGESIFQNVYTSHGGDGQIAMASSFPGEILAINLTGGKSIVAQKTAFLASETGIDFQLFFQKKLGAGFFGGEGFIMQKFTGEGYLFLELDGTIIERNLAAGESIIVDTGYLAAMDETCSIDIQMVKGIGNKLFGGEGFFNTKVTGPGHVWLQSMPIYGVASALKPYIPTSSN